MRCSKKKKNVSENISFRLRDINLTRIPCSELINKIIVFLLFNYLFFDPRANILDTS